MGLKRYYWHRQPAADAALCKRFVDCLGDGKLVVDVGGGYDPWPYATEFVDCAPWPALAGKRLHQLDVELERLPFADESVDFLYCRHTLEDLHNPTLLLREIKRVAKAGYIETPSPMAELCRGVDGSEGRYRGYSHHRWLAWNAAGTLTLLPKFSVLEFAEMRDNFDHRVIEALDANPLLWNCYFPWRGPLDFHILKRLQDFDLNDAYFKHVELGVAAHFASAQAFAAEFDLIGAQFLGTVREPQRNSVPDSGQDAGAARGMENRLS